MTCRGGTRAALPRRRRPDQAGAGLLRALNGAGDRPRLYWGGPTLWRFTMLWSTLRLIAIGGLLLPMLGGCSTAYYKTWEKLGWEKRDILVDRVKDARDDQEDAKKQFQTTLQRFQEVTGFQGKDLEAKYKKLNTEYERSEASAADVRGRIESVEKVAGDLFAEWREELKQYSDPNMRRNSERQLEETRQRYGQLIDVMKQAEGKMAPVLAAFKDQVLFLKHNLNAQAISSLQTTSAQIEGEVQQLIKDMEASIAEANKFIDQMKG
jgi:hypothetical protein